MDRKSQTNSRFEFAVDMLFRERLSIDTGDNVMVRLMYFPILVAVIFALMPIDVALAKDSDCFEKTGDVQIQACTRIIKIKRLFGTQLANVFNQRGIAYFYKGQIDLAIADYTKAIELDPDDYRPYFNRHLAYKKKGQFDQAQSDFTESFHRQVVKHQLKLTVEKETEALTKCRDEYVRINELGYGFSQEELDELFQTDAEIKDALKKCDDKHKHKRPDFFHGIEFVNMHKGWAVGWNGRIIHSNDGGATWTEQNSKTKRHLRAVDFIDDKTGFSVGFNGIVLRTTNGGLKWEEVTRPGKKKGLVFSKRGAIWTISCISVNSCWVGGEFQKRIFLTKSGGKKWIAQRTPAKGKITSLQFIDEESGFAVSGIGEIIGTINGGKKWKLLSKYNKKKFWSLNFVNKKLVWIVGTNGTVMRTVDGGATWVDQSTNIKLPAYMKKSDARLHVVKFLTPNLGWAAGLKGLIINTTNGGESWTTQAYGNSNEYTIYGMDMQNRNIGWVSGNLGKIAATIDGGRSWFHVHGWWLERIKTIAPFLEERRRQR